MTQRKLWTFLAAIGLLVTACGSAESETLQVSEPGSTLTGLGSADAVRSASETNTDSPAPDAAPSRSFAMSNDVAKKFSRWAAANLDDTIDEDWSLLTDAEERCIAEEALVVDPAILSLDEFDDATLEQQAAAFLAFLDCAPDAAQSLGTGFPADFAMAEVGDEMTSCLIDELAVGKPDRVAAAIGFMALVNEGPAPADSVDPAADMLSKCIDFGSLLTSIFDDDPVLRESVDPQCLDDALDSLGSRDWWVGLLVSPTMPGADDGDAASLVAPLFECVSFGQTIAAQLAATGVDLSPEAVGCLDQMLSDPDQIASMMSGDGAGSIGSSTTTDIFSCFNDQELTALFGG